MARFLVTEHIPLVTGTSGTSGRAIAQSASSLWDITYSTTTQISPVISDLGSAAQFSNHANTGSLVTNSTDRYAFSLRDSELRYPEVMKRSALSTTTGQVLLGVDVTGSNLSLPLIEGLTPIQSISDNKHAFALFAVTRAGLETIDVSGASGGYSRNSAHIGLCQAIGQLKSGSAFRAKSESRSIFDNEHVKIAISATGGELIIRYQNC